jgi:hypothetical protein
VLARGIVVSRISGSRPGGRLRVVRGFLVLMLAAGLGVSGVMPLSSAGAVTVRKGSGSSSTSAAALVDAESLGRTLLSPVYATTDEGGFGGGTGSFDSQATASTVSGVVLTFALSSFANAKAAGQAYQNVAGALSDATPIPGVGDEAVSSGQRAYVLKGAQVLTVTAKADQQLVDQISQLKASGGDYSGLFTRVTQALEPAAKAAGAKLTGRSASGTGSVLPAGGANPCTVSPAAMSQIYGVKGVSAQPVLSEEPPATECRYSLPGIGGVLTFVTTGDQLYNPAYPIDIYAQFQKQSDQDPTAFPTNNVFSDEMKAVELQEQPCSDPEVVKAEYDGSTELTPAKAKKALKQVADKAAGTPTPKDEVVPPPNPIPPALEAARQEAQALQTLLQAEGKLFTGDLNGFQNDIGKFSDQMGKFADDMRDYANEMRKLARAVKAFCKTRVGTRER